MARRAAGLTAAKVKTAKPGRYGDGGGLYLLVRSAELKFWLFRFVDPHAPRVDKKTGKAKLSKKGRPLPWLREMGLGPAAGPSAVSLAEARDAAAKQRQLLRAGINPRREEGRKDSDATRAGHVRQGGQTLHRRP